MTSHAALRSASTSLLVRVGALFGLRQRMVMPVTLNRATVVPLNSATVVTLHSPASR